MQYNLPHDDGPEDFGVCVKGLSMLDDYSSQVAEWIETLKAFGVNKIFIYVLEIHPKISKVF